jgi:mannosyl-3-phosphoglycerate phosphatase
MTDGKIQPVIFTDVDGCLMDKADYDYAPAVPVIGRLLRSEIPVVLCSSKTASELRKLAASLALTCVPLICENGGQIVWPDGVTQEKGVHRTEILTALAELKPQFNFRSFSDLGLEGVMASTNLPSDKARAALDRHATEPLLWEDDPKKIHAFADSLREHSLTLTRGGRFWHVAGNATKGVAMSSVAGTMEQSMNGALIFAIAVGDSPIDQSMLDTAHCPVGIPAPDGTFHVDICPFRGIRASIPGSRGWAETIGALLDRLQVPG